MNQFLITISLIVISAQEFDSGNSNLISAGDTGTLATGTTLNRFQEYTINFAVQFTTIPQVAFGYTMATIPYANQMGFKISLISVSKLSNNWLFNNQGFTVRVTSLCQTTLPKLSISWLATNDPDTFMEQKEFTSSELSSNLQSGTGQREQKISYIPTAFASKFQVGVTQFKSFATGHQITSGTHIRYFMTYYSDNGTPTIWILCFFDTSLFYISSFLVFSNNLNAIAGICWPANGFNAVSNTPFALTADPVTYPQNLGMNQDVLVGYNDYQWYNTFDLSVDYTAHPNSFELKVTTCCSQNQDKAALNYFSFKSPCVELYSECNFAGTVTTICPKEPLIKIVSGTARSLKNPLKKTIILTQSESHYTLFLKDKKCVNEINFEKIIIL